DFVRKEFYRLCADSGINKNKGLLSVVRDEKGKLLCVQECSWAKEQVGELKIVFQDGKLFVNDSLANIRSRVEAQL
ncbi:MAG: hypothetical protein Q7R33_05555, partial [Nitrosarchaeum sp.]|nr:hypothetical protein [Nitrosarchaeum sp.]